MTAQVEAPAGLEWLRGTLEDLRGEIGEARKSVVSVRMRVAALEEDVKIVRRENEELRTELASANEQLDESSASMRAAVKGDVLSDIDELSRRDRALASALVLVTAKIMQAGPESLARLGLPEDVVATIRGLVYGGPAASVPPVAFMDSGNGLRYTAPPTAAQTPQAPARNSVTFTHMPAEERELIEYRSELLARERGPADLMPRRASDRAG